MSIPTKGEKASIHFSRVYDSQADDRFSIQIQCQNGDHIMVSMSPAQLADLITNHPVEATIERWRVERQGPLAIESGSYINVVEEAKRAKKLYQGGA